MNSTKSLNEQSFEYDGELIPYNQVPFNHIAERAIEVPLFFKFLVEHLAELKGPRVLEVGAVLHNYENYCSHILGIFKRIVVDKFEIGNGIVNEGIVEFCKSNLNAFDLIFSISTIEHIGMSADPSGTYGEEQGKDYSGPAAAIFTLCNALRPGGVAYLSFPFGEGADHDWLVCVSGSYLNCITRVLQSAGFSCETTYFKRDEYHNKNVWRQCSQVDLKLTKFNAPHEYANGVCFLKIVKGALSKKITSIPDFGELLKFRVLAGTFHKGFHYKGDRSSLPFQLESEEQTALVYGPYVKAGPGRYRVVINGSGLVDVDVGHCGGANMILCVSKLDLNIDQPEELIFTLLSWVEDLELRLHGKKLRLMSVVIERI